MHDVLKSSSRVWPTTHGLRVLFAVFQTGLLSNGGVESITAVITAMPEMDRLVITNRETPFCARWRAAGARVVVWDMPYERGTLRASSGLLGGARRAWWLLRTNLQTAHWIRRGDVQLIHCNDPAPFWHVAPAAKVFGIPLVFNLRDTKGQDERWDARRYRRRFRLSARVLVLSHEMREFYQRTMPPPPQASIEAIHSAVDFEKFGPASSSERAAIRARLGIAPEIFAIGFMAAFSDKKNQLGYLRAAVPALRRLHPAARTYFIGDYEPARDAYARECAALAAQEGRASAVSLLGYTPAVADWYRACDLVVVPTRKEGLARCMIEALACGTPVVSFDVSSAREILEKGECGTVVPQGDYEALARAIATHATEPSTQQRLRANALSTARRLFTPERMIADYRRLYQSLSQAQS